MFTAVTVSTVISFFPVTDIREPQIAEEERGCAILEDLLDRDGCAYDVAIKYRKAGLCQRVSDKVLRDRCQLLLLATVE